MGLSLKSPAKDSSVHGGGGGGAGRKMRKPPLRIKYLGFPFSWKNWFLGLTGWVSKVLVNSCGPLLPSLGCKCIFSYFSLSHWGVRRPGSQFEQNRGKAIIFRASLRYHAWWVLIMIPITTKCISCALYMVLSLILSHFNLCNSSERWLNINPILPKKAV